MRVLLIRHLQIIIAVYCGRLRIQYIVVDILQHIGYIGRAVSTMVCADSDNILARVNRFPQKNGIHNPSTPTLLRAVLKCT